MNPANDPRTEELDHLKLALAPFALRLDAFEMRTHEVLLAVRKPGNRVLLANRGRALRKDDVIGGQ